MQEPVIILKSVSVSLQGKKLLDDISFVLNKGEHLGIIGASGSGKTLLAKALAGQLFVRGEIKIRFNEANALQPKVEFVAQRHVFKNLSNISTFYYQQRFNSSDAADAATVMQELCDFADVDTQVINSLLYQLGLAYRKDASVIQLSSGEHKRLQLLKALLKPAQVIILDQPFTGLDAQTRAKLHTIINELASAEATIIIISNADEIPACITHVAWLEGGRVNNFETKDAFDFSQAAHQLSSTHFDIHKMPSNNTQNNFSYAVKMKNAGVCYDEKIIFKNINWSIRKGERWLLRGANGAGKSTLLSLIYADNPQAYANEIYLFDKRRGLGESIWDVKKQIGYMSPELHAFFDSSVTCYQAVASGFFDTIGLFKKINPQQDEIVKQWLQFLQLSNVHQKLFSSISTGMQRLILLARALVKNPPLLILDEPCQGLDDMQKQQLIQLVEDICSQTETTLIYVSHYNDEIPLCVEHVLELSNGSAIKYSINKTAVAV